MTVKSGYFSTNFGSRFSHVACSNASKGRVVCCLLPLFALASMQVSAATYTLQAITDFENIAAGEVPYYVDDAAERNALAIDAALLEYRGKFARAVTTFAGVSGVYDVTITALGEIDGEGEFRFLVNGGVVGSAVNELVTEDWVEQYHVIENVSINTGDEIAVESDARSNGLIPENGEYAFARGRWRTLELTLDDAATANPVTVNLSLALTLQPQEVEPADLVTAAVSVINLSSNVATNPEVEVTLPDNLVFVSGDGCVESGADNVFKCSMDEITASATAVLGLALLANETGSAQVSVQVTADQADSYESDNSDIAVVEIVASEAGTTATEVATTEATQAATELATEAASSEATSNAVDSAANSAMSVANQAATSVVTGETNVTDGSQGELENANASGSSGGSGRPSMLLHLLLAACLLRRSLSATRL